jgi:hypothetical protein
VRCPARVQCRQHGRSQPGPLGCGQRPGRAERGKELSSPPAAAGGPACCGQRPAPARGGGGRFYARFLGCSGAPAAPRFCAGCTPSACRLRPVPGAGCNCSTPSGQLSTASLPAATGCGACTPSAWPSAPGQHCWKACWGQPLASSNLASSARLTCGDAKTVDLAHLSIGLLVSVFVSFICVYRTKRSNQAPVSRPRAVHHRDRPHLRAGLHLHQRRGHRTTLKPVRPITPAQD